MYRLEWTDDDQCVEFHPSTARWIAILRENGFEVLDFRELFAPDDAGETVLSTTPLEWARRWPDEEIWRARKRA